MATRGSGVSTRAAAQILSGALALGLVAAVPLGTQAAGHARQAAAPTTLNVGLAAPVYSLDPAASYEFEDNYVMYAIYANLFTYNSNFTIEPGLVTSWSTPNPTTYVFHLRKGVRFSDGTPFNAAAVVFDLERDLAKTSPRASHLSMIKSVVAVNPYTVRITMTAPSPDLPSILARRAGLMPSPTAVRKAGSSYGVENGALPVGAGPYMVQSWPNPDEIILVKNPYYYDPQAVYFKKIIFHVVTDTTTRVIELQSGQLNIIDQVFPNDLKPLAGDKSVKILKFPSEDWYDLEFNCSVAPFNNVLVRQAMAYAINRNEINTIAFSGAGNPNPHLITGGWAYNPHLKTFPFDPAKARQLLAQAGYPHGFSVTLLSSSGSPTYSDEAEIIQSNLANIGVKVTIEPENPNTEYSQEVAGKFSMALSNWTPRQDPGYTLAMHYEYGQSTDYYQYNNPKVNTLLSEANSTYDIAKRKALLQQAEEIIYNQVPALYLDQPYSFVAMSAPIQGYIHYPDDIMHVAFLRWG